MDVPRNVDLEPMLTPYDPPVQQLARQLDALLFQQVHPLYRTGEPGENIVGYQRTPGYKGTLFTIILSKNGVKLGIPYSASIQDPQGLLHGSGKVHKHIPFEPGQPVNTPDVVTMIQAAVQAWEARSAIHS